MVALQVRDIPQGLYGQLKESARLNRRSLSREAVSIIESFFSDKGEGVASPDPVCESQESWQQRAARRQQIFQNIAAINAGAPDGVDPAPQPGELIASMRQERGDRPCLPGLS